MSLDNILNATIDTFKQSLQRFCEENQIQLDTIDSDSFALMTKGLMEAAQKAGITGLCKYLKQNDTLVPNIVHNQTTYRFKGTSTKQLLTLFGTITIDRAMYYNENQGGCYYFPLDQALSIQKNDFATLETREMILFATASCVPAELHTLLKKCSLCNPSTTAIQNIINKDGEAIEEHSKQLSTNVFQTVEIPQQTHAIIASLDGANVLLREAGAKKGRKNIRPGEKKKQTTSTSYHNAMVGAVSFYGIDDENIPERLESIYTARMPQEKTITFKDDFERIVTLVENKCNEHKIPVVKVLLTNAHLMIKGFAKKNKHLMKYPDFIARNLPIGSGPIEAAAKTIIKQRMCRSGMRWTRKKGQYVLTIRAFVQSGL